MRLGRPNLTKSFGCIFMTAIQANAWASLTAVEMGQLIKATGAIATVKPAKGDKFSLDELHDYVGGYIEALRLNDGRWMVINEEGRLKDLQFNSLASHLYQYDYIVGDVVICDEGEID